MEKTIVERELTVTLRIQLNPPRLLTYVTDSDGLTVTHTDIGPTSEVLSVLPNCK